MLLFQQLKQRRALQRHKHIVQWSSAEDKTLKTRQLSNPSAVHVTLLLTAEYYLKALLISKNKAVFKYEFVCEDICYPDLHLYLI